MKMNREGDALLEFYRQQFEPAETKRDASKAVRLLVTTRLNNNQFSALVCLICGISIDTFRKARILRLLNRNDMLIAAEEFTKFVYVTDDAGRRIIDEPTLRQRELQKDLFLKPELIRKSKRSVCK